MTIREQILQTLRESAEISGEALSKRLGISRAAVAKHIKALREEGYAIKAAPRRGYSFLAAADSLSAAEIGCFLQKKAACWQIHYYRELPSTTTVLRELATKGAPHGTVLIAEAQQAGEGRLSRSWFSPAKSGLWMSFLLRPPLSAQLAQTMTLLTACATALVLDKMGFACGIKWPNDVLALDGRKLCGIKSEMCADMDSVQWLVTGLGLNINTPCFPPDLNDCATSLYMLGGQILPRAPIAAALLDELYRLYQTLLERGFAPIRELWLNYALSLGQRVRVSNAREEYYAIARGLDENGYLLAEHEGKLKTITGGDIWLDI
ncbi:MAG: biotin--[acetyl-CoA-carboxylase] ligase [Clostridiales bacterium]|nr:biotin--[acetyl-CoA-carboxylase] ligase [Clostridiales bacterium]